jgi:hypothetical protein
MVGGTGMNKKDKFTPGKIFIVKPGESIDTYKDIRCQNPLRLVLEELANLYDLKAKDYAGTEKYRNFKLNGEIWNERPYIQMLKRLSEKVIRINQINQNGTANFEGIEDSIKDIVVLGVMALDEFREEHGN